MSSTPRRDRLRSYVEACYESGWRFTHLAPRDKKPTRDNWNREQPAPLAEVVRWIDADSNIGLRTGLVSGVAVIDVDGPEPDGLALPPTVTVKSSRGRHYYYRAAGPLPNPLGKLSEHVDLRGDGAQVVFPGSLHPSGVEYEWENHPADIDLADFPISIMPENDRLIYDLWPLIREPHESLASMLGRDARLTLELMHECVRRAGSSGVSAGVELPPVPPLPSPPARNTPRDTGRYIDAALRGEWEAVAGAGPGKRNGQLYTSSLKLGRYIAEGHIDADEIEQTMLSASESNGTLAEDGEARCIDTIRRGISRGREMPREVPDRPSPPVRSTAATAPSLTAAVAASLNRWVLMPGEHVDDEGQYHRIDNKTFVLSVMDRMPRDVYRRAGVAGQLIRQDGKLTFEPFKAQTMRVFVDEHCHLSKWEPATKDKPARRRFIPCSRDTGDMLLCEAGASPRINELQMVVPYPVFVRDDAGGWRLHPAGFSGGIYSDAHGMEIPEVSVAEAVAVLQDITVDFPFREEADRENFFGLMLTPLIRPAVGESPLHVVEATREGTGKTLLVDRVFGITMLGRSLSQGQITSDESETDKRILAALLRGETLWSIDNVNVALDSSSLCSLLTAKFYRGRVLGLSKEVELPVTMTSIVTANNIEVSGEMGRRCIPIRLLAREARPEKRRNFVHPDLDEYMLRNRARVWGALIGLVNNWLAAGSPPGWNEIGSYNKWSRAVGGILAAAGLTQWGTKNDQWRAAADAGGADLAAFIERWASRYPGEEPVTPAKLCELATLPPALYADEIGWKRDGPSRALALGGLIRKVKERVVETEVGAFQIKVEGAGSMAKFWLEEVR